MSVVTPALAALRPLLGGARAAALRTAFDRAAHLLGLTDVRTDREPGTLTLQLGAPGTQGLAVIDTRGAAPRTYRLDTESDDIVAQLEAIRGGQTGLRAKIIVDPASCFARTLVLPSAALPRMRAMLAQELESATPFRVEAVYSDWFVEGEDAQARTLRVRHVVLKRARLEPLLATLQRAGLAVGPVTVGQDEDRTMPVDLLSGGHRALRGVMPGARTGDIVLVAAACCLVLTASWGFRQRQADTLAALDAAFAAARLAAGPMVPAPVRAATTAMLDKSAPSVARTWEAIAAALPDTASATDLHLDAQGAIVTVITTDEEGALASLAALPGFGSPFIREPATGEADARKLVVVLPRDAAGARP